MEQEKGKQPARMIGYWMSEKKRQKLNWKEFAAVCRKQGFDLVKLDLSRPLQDQGPFTVILHKLTDIIALAEKGDIQARYMIARVEAYILAHPEVAVIDPLDNVRRLLNRYHSYSLIHNMDLEQERVFTPAFVELTSVDREANIRKLTAAGIQFPFVCKPLVAHGSSDAHKMALIFSEEGVKDCKPPCVAQTFINHNAILYKIYFVGDKYSVIERPSLKNFPSGVGDRQTIFFDSHAVSKADSTSSLNVLDPEDQIQPPLHADYCRFQSIVRTLRRELGMSLLGVDVVIENGTGRHAIIDINVYPGYDGYPNFFEDLMSCIMEVVAGRAAISVGRPGPRACAGDFDDSGFDTSDSSDEKNKPASIRK
ncbi:inositol-tetrakisphosphate 1-kinase-like [Bacillus rossius redtenbacheri]|uniref:inositol-tetrakisphosphate 1-kinase-like n=1 Tax=Bacillus rossius redtenbacheri TaxID=93214 RepID=UPI002FDEB912